MNRIVLIGNGFDLAHGLKTSYKNFIDWYWNDWGDKLLHGLNKTETDGLCSFKLNILNIAFLVAKLALKNATKKPAAST